MQLEVGNNSKLLEKGFYLEHWWVDPHSNSLQNTKINSPSKNQADCNNKSNNQNIATKHIESKAMQVLLQLAAHAGEFLKKEDIINKVWANRAVTDDVLTVAISAIRKATGDSPSNPYVIETRKGVGYRLIAKITNKKQAQQPNILAWSRYSVLFFIFTLIVFAFSKVYHQQFNEEVTHAKVIAVLPFISLSQEKGYLADAMTEALIYSLAESNQLNVISRTSVMPYRDQSKPLTLIAKELGAELLVEGSIQKENDRVRITAQLIDANSDIHIWAKRYDRPFVDVLALQHDIADEITQQINHVSAPERQSDLSNFSKSNLSVSSLAELMKARYLLAQKNVDAATRSVPIFESIASEYLQDPNSRLGKAQALLFLYKQGKATERLSEARQLVEEAIKLDPKLSQAYACLGQIVYFQDWNYRLAESHYQKAIMINPSNVDARRRYAWLLVGLGRYQESLAQIEQLKWLDPHYYIRPDTGLLWLYAGETEKAITELSQLYLSEPDSWGINHVLQRSLAVAGRYEESMPFLFNSLKLSGRTSDEVNKVRSIFAKQGWREAFRFVLQQQWVINPVRKAEFYAHLGDDQQVFHWLNIAVSDRSPGTIYIGVRPEFAELRRDPRFLQLLQQLKLAK